MYLSKFSEYKRLTFFAIYVLIESTKRAKLPKDSDAKLQGLIRSDRDGSQLPNEYSFLSVTGGKVFLYFSLRFFNKLLRFYQPSGIMCRRIGGDSSEVDSGLSVHRFL